MAAAIATARMEARRRSRRFTPRLLPAVPALSVVLVNYCQWNNTARLAKQLRQSHATRFGHAEIVIVDNHSPGNPVIRKLRRAEGISLRRFKRNRGFAAGVNEGCRLSRGEWILLLNPDMSVEPGFLDRVEALARDLSASDPQAGIVGLGVRNSDGSAQPSCGPMPTLMRTLAGLLLPRSIRKCKPVATDASQDVPWVTGCALLVRRDCLKDLGGFDESFFLYYEDVDLCRRAAERGWKVRHEPNLHVTHHTPLHTRPLSAPLRFVTRHALLNYGTKHWSRLQSIVLGGLVWLEACFRQFTSWWKGNRQESFFHRQTRKVVRHVLAGRDREVRRTIREAADHLAAGAAAFDGSAA